MTEQSLREAIQEVLGKLLPAKLVFTPDMEEPGAMKRLTAQFMDECLEELLSLISKHVEAEKLEARIDELEQIASGKTIILNDIYGDDWRNNYGYNATQVRDAAHYLQGRWVNRAKDRLASLNNERKK